MTQTTEDLAVLFVDICGSTQTYEKLGDEEGLGEVRQAWNRLAELGLRQAGEGAEGPLASTAGPGSP